MKSKNSISLYRVLFAVVLAASNSGCGGALSSPPPSPPSVTPADITGPWSIVVEGSPGFPEVFANISSQGGGDFFATGANTAACDFSAVQCQVTNTPNLTIQVSQSNRVTATISNVILNTGTTESISADGAVDSTGLGMSGTWISHGGLEHGTWQAKKSFAVAGGPYIGSMNSTVSPAPIPVGVSMSFGVDASFNLTASATFTNSACFTSLSFSGRAVGGAFYMTDSTSCIVVVGIVIVNPLTPEAAIGYKVLSGCDSGDQGQGTISVPVKF